MSEDRHMNKHKLTIFNTDGSQTEVEPLKMWQPTKKCMFGEKGNTCPKDATTSYSYGGGVDIPLCDYHLPIYENIVKVIQDE